ncbi:hypothetical protein G7Y89_g13744 [Cudoniella acicularis]|uniref:F-box domain-containing protein n=1 Tax=Cudoniella acicularis TaxID=354080 RepID=A0A8H4R930_9HELO|nr:hypothetical protein G7Y89_g13744 [Cudoniella acicularis]
MDVSPVGMGMGVAPGSQNARQRRGSKRGRTSSNINDCREHQALASNHPFSLLAYNPESSSKRERWQQLFHSLPTELDILILAHADPVTQMCLGLTNRYYHGVFHALYNFPSYNIHRYPFGLSLQISICENYTLNWLYEDWFLRDAEDIAWERCLGELLYEEKSLWGDLSRCEGCWVYKPSSAFGRFDLEVETYRAFWKEIDCFEKEDIEWYGSQCRRCRAKFLLVVLWRKEEIFDDSVVDCERESLGVRRRRSEAVKKVESREKELSVQNKFERKEDL